MADTHFHIAADQCAGIGAQSGDQRITDGADGCDGAYTNSQAGKKNPKPRQAGAHFTARKTPGKSPSVHGVAPASVSVTS